MPTSFNDATTSNLSLPSQNDHSTFSRFAIWTAIILALFLVLAGARVIFLVLRDFIRRSRTPPQPLDIEKASLPTSDTANSFSSIFKLYLWISSGEYGRVSTSKDTPCLILTSPSFKLKDILVEANFSTDGGLKPRLRSDELAGYLSPKSARHVLETMELEPVAQNLQTPEPLAKVEAPPDISKDLPETRLDEVIQRQPASVRASLQRQPGHVFPLYF
jgi:hypothetical protein